MEPLKIFLGISGPRSHEIAETLKKLLSKVFRNNVRCFSSEEIPAGVDWYAEIENALREADIRVICFTPENIDSQWLLFEAIALIPSILAKGQHEYSVYPYLFQVLPDHIPQPINLLRPQLVTADEEGTKKLLKSINSRLGAIQFPKEKFDELFEKAWESIDVNSQLRTPTRDEIGQMLGIIRTSTKRISSDLQKVAANRLAEFLLKEACDEFFNNFTVTDKFTNFTAPASTYPHYLLLLLEEFGCPVKAIALVDVEEDFWQGPIGSEIFKNTPNGSKRVFVFSSPEHLEKNFLFFLRHARKYGAYAMSKTNLDRGFCEYAYDFSIIETPETKILAKYKPTDKIKSILFTTDPRGISLHENALNEVILKSIEMKEYQAEELLYLDFRSKGIEAQMKSFIESVFAEVKLTPLSQKPVEMSKYISVHDYAQYEEQHAYFTDMMETMLSRFKRFNKLRDEKTPCRVLELGAGTGHFTKRLIPLKNVLVTAVEIDWECYKCLKDDLKSDRDLKKIHDDGLTAYYNYLKGDLKVNCKLKVVNDDSRRYPDHSEETFDFIFSSFADHHIKPEDKMAYFENIMKNLSPEGVLIVGDEFIPSCDLNDKASFESAVRKYHNHIIEIAKKEGHDKLVELETAAMDSGLRKEGDFKMPREEYERCLEKAGLSLLERDKIGPEDLDDVGGIYVYVIKKKPLAS